MTLYIVVFVPWADSIVDSAWSTQEAAEARSLTLNIANGLWRGSAEAHDEYHAWNAGCAAAGCACLSSATRVVSVEVDA